MMAAGPKPPGYHYPAGALSMSSALDGALIAATLMVGVVLLMPQADISQIISRDACGVVMLAVAACHFALVWLGRTCRSCAAMSRVCCEHFVEAGLATQTALQVLPHTPALPDKQEVGARDLACWVDGYKWAAREQRLMRMLRIWILRAFRLAVRLSGARGKLRRYVALKDAAQTSSQEKGVCDPTFLGKAPKSLGSSCAEPAPALGDTLFDECADCVGCNSHCLGPRSGRGEARADFNAAPYGPEFLSLRGGDQIIILMRQPRGASERLWAYGFVNGHGPGWFPADYVEPSPDSCRSAENATLAPTTDEKEVQTIALAEVSEGSGSQGAQVQSDAQTQVDMELAPAPQPVVFFDGRSFCGTETDFEDLSGQLPAVLGKLGSDISIAFSARWDRLPHKSCVICLGGDDMVDTMSVCTAHGTLEFTICQDSDVHSVAASDIVRCGELCRVLCSVSTTGCMRIMVEGCVVAENSQGQAECARGLHLAETLWKHLYVARPNPEPFCGQIADVRVWNEIVEWNVPWSATADFPEHPAQADVKSPVSPAPSDVIAELTRLAVNDHQLRDMLKAKLQAKTASVDPSQCQAQAPSQAPSAPASPKEARAEIVAQLQKLQSANEELRSELQERQQEVAASAGEVSGLRFELQEAGASRSAQDAEAERLRSATGAAERRAASAEAELQASRFTSAARGAFGPGIAPALRLHWAVDEIMLGSRTNTQAVRHLRNCLCGRSAQLRVEPPPTEWNRWLQLNLRQGLLSEPVMLRLQCEGSTGDAYIGVLWPAPDT